MTAAPAAEASPAAGIDFARADHELVEATACLTGDDEEANGGRTRPQIDLVAASRRAEPVGSRTDFPDVPGYEVIERLGHGGMGVVFKARDLGLNRLVALKMIRGGTEAKPEFFKRFSTEAEAIARLRHSSIIQIYDIGEANGLPYVALELLEGGGLDDRIAGTPQPASFAADLVATLGAAIQVAHQVGIIHRDLKPSNVLYTSDDVPKITDFGLAKRIDSDDHQTESGQIMGSPSYMAPEQAKGHSKEVGAAADIYALGAVFYEMLTGRPPFKGESPIATIRQVIDDEPVPPARLVPRLPLDLETICLKCLNKDPARRYESAQALALDLRRYLRGEPILARRTSTWERARKWARRRPWAAAALAFGITAFMGAILGAFVQQRRSFLLDLQLVREGNRLMEVASKATDRDRLTREHANLTNFVKKMPARADFDELRSRLDEELHRVEGRINELLTNEAVSTREREQREQLKRFRDLRKQAQLYAVRLGVIEPAEHQKSLRNAALSALAIFAHDPAAPAGAWGLASPLPEAFDQAEKDEVKAGCFDLLSILSDAVVPAEGLKVLDCAARLRPEPSSAIHLRRAAVLVQSGDKACGAREERLARESRPTTALDHFLIGREQIARKQFRDAIHSAQSAVRLDPNQLGAHLILAEAYFNVQRYSEAKASLNLCIQSAPDLLGLYLFRARVFGDEGNAALVKIKEAPSRAAEWQLEAAESFAAAQDDYRQAIELRPSPDLLYVLLVNRGGMNLQAGRLDEAIADVESAAKQNARPFYAHALLAQIYQQQGSLDQAAIALDRAIERQPDRPELFRAPLLAYRPTA